MKRKVRRRVGKKPETKSQKNIRLIKTFLKKYRIYIISGVFALIITFAMIGDSVFSVSASSENGPDGKVVYSYEDNSERADDSGSYVTADGRVMYESSEAADDPTILSYNPDTRSGYLNNCIFLGDSRTVAMVNYGCVQDDDALAQIGIAHTAVEKNVFTMNSGKQYTLDSYVSSHKRPVIYICYGVNGMNFIDEDKYKTSYTELVEHIHSLSPESKLVIMSIWPVEDDGKYSGAVKNEWINKYNDFLYELAVKEGIFYLDISSVLTADDGSMIDEFDAGDGLHYCAYAYNTIMDYIIHHPVQGVSDEGEYIVKYIPPSSNARVMNSNTDSVDPQMDAIDYSTILNGNQFSTQNQNLLPTRAPEVTNIPTNLPTEVPTDIPTQAPTQIPTQMPLPTETPLPTEAPAPEPTEAPQPEETPIPEPTEAPAPIEEEPVPEPEPDNLESSEEV